MLGCCIETLQSNAKVALKLCIMQSGAIAVTLPGILATWYVSIGHTRTVATSR
eukprot:COSAG02_NODE_1761_length_11029_cov_46.691034_4_plen_53_part_00